jgi:hypothetical protein
MDKTSVWKTIQRSGRIYTPDVEQYEGETMVGVQGDMAIVQFINMDWVAKFRGSGSKSCLRCAGWRWGRK